MPASQRVLAVLATFAMLLTAAPAALAAGPVRTVFSLNDPALDTDEAAFWTATCGFAVGVDNSGHINVLEFPAGSRSMLEIDAYDVHTTYVNLATGTTVRLRDAGPDRFYVRDGRVYVGITGRSTTGTGVIGLVVFDFETGAIVHTAGNDVGLFQDTLCEALAG